MSFALVIDDNREQADALCRIISLLGVEAKPVYGPKSAMQVLKDEKPSVVFLDISMPGVDGFEVLAFLQREPGRESTPVIIVSSDDQTLTIRKAMEKGALHYLVKPVSLSDVEKILRKTRVLRNTKI